MEKKKEFNQTIKTMRIFVNIEPYNIKFAGLFNENSSLNIFLKFSIDKLKKLNINYKPGRVELKQNFAILLPEYKVSDFLKDGDEVIVYSEEYGINQRTLPGDDYRTLYKNKISGLYGNFLGKKKNRNNQVNNKNKKNITIENNNEKSEDNEENDNKNNDNDNSSDKENNENDNSSDKNSDPDIENNNNETKNKNNNKYDNKNENKNKSDFQENKKKIKDKSKNKNNNNKQFNQSNQKKDKNKEKEEKNEINKKKEAKQKKNDSNEVRVNKYLDDISSSDN